MIVHLALQDAGFDQIIKTVYKHFTVAVEAFFKGAGPAHLVDYIAELFGDLQILERCFVGIVLLLPEFAAIYDGISQGADSDLQGAAIGNQGAGVQTDHVVDSGDRHVGGREQGRVVIFVVDDDIEGVFLDDGIVDHKRQVFVHLGDQQDGFSSGLAS